MKITKEVQAQARRLVRLCTDADGLLQENAVRQIATAISTEKPRHYLALLHAFTELVRLAEARRTVTVTSAVPLTSSEQDAICRKLNARQGGLEYIWRTDPELLGGMTVKVGDNMTDASLRTRIERLSRLS